MICRVFFISTHVHTSTLGICLTCHHNQVPTSSSWYWRMLNAYMEIKLQQSNVQQKWQVQTYHLTSEPAMGGREISASQPLHSKHSMCITVFIIHKASSTKMARSCYLIKPQTPIYVWVPKHIRLI